MTPLRRLLILLLLAAAGGAAWSWMRGRSGAAVPTDPPEWPPLDTATSNNAFPPPDPSTAAPKTWVEPAEDGSCPEGYPVKANANSGIFHMPEGRFYERTKADRCYPSAEAAIADGYRRAKS